MLKLSLHLPTRRNKTTKFLKNIKVLLPTMSFDVLNLPLPMPRP